MRIGITCNVKHRMLPPADAPDDWEEEFDKQETVDAIATALCIIGHDVAVLHDGPEMLRSLLANPPDFVFNIAEGAGISRSREARVPAVLEMLGIPYYGSDPLTLAVTLDKDCAKRLVASAGIPTPRWITLGTGNSCQPFKARHPDFEDWVEQVKRADLRFPVIVKPTFEGSSKGISALSVVEFIADLAERFRFMASTYRQPILVEEFIAGQEVTVGILGNNPPRVLGSMAISPAAETPLPSGRFVYSVDVKRNSLEKVRYDVPPVLPEDVIRKVESAALSAFHVFGCRDAARLDFRVRDAEPYFLDMNPLPGLNPESSDLVIMAGRSGISHSRLVQELFAIACQRYALAI